MGLVFDLKKHPSYYIDLQKEAYPPFQRKWQSYPNYFLPGIRFVNCDFLFTHDSTSGALNHELIVALLDGSNTNKGECEYCSYPYSGWEYDKICILCLFAQTPEENRMDFALRIVRTPGNFNGYLFKDYGTKSYALKDLILPQELIDKYRR